MSIQQALQHENHTLGRSQLKQVDLLLNDAVTSYQATASPRLSNKQVDTLRENAHAAATECLSIDNNNIDAMNIIARLNLDKNNFKQATRWAKSALAIDSKSATTWYSLGQIRLASNDLEAAEQAFTKCIELDPSLFRAHTSYAYTKLKQGNLVVAFQYYRRLAKANPKDPHVKSKLFECLKQLKADFDNTDLAQDLCHYFDFDDVNYNDLANLTTSLMAHRYHISDPNAVVDIAKLNQDNLLLTSLQKLIFHDAKLETFLTDIRQYLLLSELQTFDNKSPKLIIAFAWQAFNNEYAFIESAAETEVINQLSVQLAFTDIEELIRNPQQLMLLTMYRNLNEVFSDILLTRLANKSCDVWSEGMNDLMAILLADYKDGEQRPLARMGNINNVISKAVKGQYELNPYPRWLALDHHTPTSYAEALETSLVNFKAPAILKKNPVNILVAGCGTGRHALHVARYFRDAKVLAIDISAKSLQYAQKMAAHYDIHNVEFLQADILELNQIQQEFDIIECSGVLHHMQNPLAGARILSSMLAPNGIMKIGLYSERARESVVVCRNLIESENIPCSAAGIRQLRGKIIEQSDKEAWKNILISPDFYNLSGCRDLLFHVQEHRFTPHQIAKLVNDIDMTFLGFSNLSSKTVGNYRKQFTSDITMTDLDNWQQYELEHSNTFAAMYQFYVQKT